MEDNYALVVFTDNIALLMNDIFQGFFFFGIFKFVYFFFEKHSYQLLLSHCFL